MLQKLLIAFCTMFLLSACGGSSNNSAPTPTDPPDTTDPEPKEPEEPEETEEPEPEDGWAEIQFNEAGEIDAWRARCQGEGCAADADLTWSEEEQALVVSPVWVTDSDQLEVLGALDPEVFDMTGANALVSLYVTDAYITDGNLRAQLLFTTAAGGLGYIGNTGVVAGWNHILVEDIQVGTEEGAHGSFGWYNGAFTLDNVNAVGVQLIANGKPVDVGGDLWIDNVTVSSDTITPPETETPVEEPTNGITVDMTSGWRVNPNTITWEYTAEGVSYQPTAADDQLVFDPTGSLDMRGGSIDFVYEVDQAFIDSGANLQPFFQLKDYASFDYHFCWIGNGDLATGEKTFTCEVPAALANGTEAQIPDGETAQVGVQTNGGGAGTVTIKSVTIHPAE